MKNRAFALLIPIILVLASGLVLLAAPPESQCVGDVNGNGVGDIVDVMATAVAPDCQVYLPVVAANWRQPWPTLPGSCIPSGDHSSIQNALTDVGSKAVR